MGAKNIKPGNNNLEVVYKKDNSQDRTRHNPKNNEIKNHLKIAKSTKKLREKTSIIPETKESLARAKKDNEQSRKKTLKATDNNMGKGGGNSGNSSNGKKSKKIIALNEKTSKKTAAQVAVLEKSGLQLGRHGEVVETYLEVWKDEKKLAAKIEKINKASKSIQKQKNITEYFAKKGQKIPKEPFEIMKKLSKEFIVNDIDKKTGKDVRRFKSLTEFVSGKKASEMGFFEKIKTYFKAFFSGKYFVYQAAKRAQKEIKFADFVAKKGETAVKKYHKVEGNVREAATTAKKLKGEIYRAKDVVKTPALRNFITKSNQGVKDVMKNMAKLGPAKFREKLSQEYAKISAKIGAYGLEGIRALQTGNGIVGMEVVNGRGAKINGIKSVGKGAFFRVTAETIKAAIKNRRWGEFTTVVTSPTWISNTAEMLPIYGTIASFKRLNDFSSGTSAHFRKFEFALNLAFDLMTIIPFLLAGGVSLGFATPLILAIRGAASRGIKFLAKYLVTSPRIMKWIGKTLPDLTEKAIANQKNRLTKEGLASTSKKSSQGIIGKSAKKSGKSLAKKNQIWREIKWTTGSEALLAGVDTALDNKEKILNFAIDKSSFGKTQKKVIKMAGHRLAA